MARKKSQGFNSPFHDLKLPPKEAPPPPVPKAAPAARVESQSDEAYFESAMSGVAPIDHNRARVEPDKTPQRKGPDDEALALQELKSLVDGDAPFKIADSEEELSGTAPGVSHETLLALRTGDFAFRRHIDLHGLRREEAKEALVGFVTTARREGERCVLVVTGRGKGSPSGVSVLREALPRWLSRAPLRAHVLAFSTAQAVHGGPGAFYVLLRRQGVRPFGISG